MGSIVDRLHNVIFHRDIGGWQPDYVRFAVSAIDLALCRGDRQVVNIVSPSPACFEYVFFAAHPWICYSRFSLSPFVL